MFVSFSVSFHVDFYLSWMDFIIFYYFICSMCKLVCVFFSLPGADRQCGPGETIENQVKCVCIGCTRVLIFQSCLHILLYFLQLLKKEKRSNIWTLFKPK